MLIFRLLHDWDSKNEEFWDRLIQKQLGPHVHSDRKLAFIRSREALIQCFAEIGQKLQIDQLELESFSQLKDFKQYHFSLSHNKEWGAALLATNSDYLSVGIDIEEQTRELKNSVLERISHPRDLKFSPIIIWSIKEAAFKALMNSQKFEKPIEFNSIEIMSDEFIHQGTGIKGKWKQIPHHSLVIIQAWIKAF
jgi:phosphopantetheinyl transferase (holo-ACP synthase)